MLIFRQLFRFYINASIHVALAVVSLYVINVQNLNILVNKNLMGFLFFATIVCYNFVKYGVEAEKYLIVAKPSHRKIQVFSFLAFGACLYFLLHLPAQLWWVIAFFTAITALYAIPFLPSSKNLRSLGGLKIFLVAAVWVGFTVVLPVMEQQLGFSKPVVLLGLQTFLLVLILILPFEIRDLHYDKVELKTLPQRWGVTRTKQFGYVLVSIFILLGILLANNRLEKIVFCCLSSTFLIVVLLKSKQGQSTYFSSFWVEGIPVALLLVNVTLSRIGG